MARRVVNDPITDARTTTSLQGLFNPTPEISQQFRSGMMKSGLGYERWFRDQTVIKHTTGSFTAGIVNGGSQSMSSQGGNLITNAITGTLNQGDIITVANVNSVNCTTKQSNGTLMQFVVTAPVLSGATSIPIYPGLLPSSTGVASVVRNSSIRLLMLRLLMRQRFVSLRLLTLRLSQVDCLHLVVPPLRLRLL